MKNLHIYTLVFVLLAGLWSCGENEDFSTLHTLTNDELAEIARQDSLAEAAKNRLNADLVVNYDVEITTSATLYDGTAVTIDMTPIAEIFGLSEEDLLAGIGGEDGAPNIRGFAMEGEQHTDVSGASNTNAPWGHWWDADNKVTTWGETAMVFAEFDYETSVFNVGQYPDHLTDGQSLQIIECLRYNEIRVAVVMNITAKAPGEVSAQIVSTQNLTAEVFPRVGFDSDSVQFNLDQALADLGVSSMDEVSFVSVNADGSFNVEPTVEGIGFWYDMSGELGEYGENSSFSTYYGEFMADKISLGQYPGNISVGDDYTIEYGLMANNQIVMLEIAISVVDYDNPETAPAGDPEDLTADVTMSKAYSDDYANITTDIAETLRNAFKLTTYEIAQAIVSGDLKLYQGEVTEEDPSYTADVPGYWLQADGTAGGWGESLVWCSIGYTETELYFFGGNHPANAVAGDSVSTTYIASYNGGTATFNITFNVE